MILERSHDLIDELIYFPRFKHDDLVDALGFAVEEAASEAEYAGELHVYY